MAELLSPGVAVTEIDASTIVPTVSNSVGVFCGDFKKGPIESYRFITNVSELVDFYGEPTDTNYNDFYQAYNFLQYGNKLLVARAGDSALLKNSGLYIEDNAGTTITDYSANNVLVKNYDDFENSTYPMSATNDKLLIMARSAGTWGNSIEVAIANADDFVSGTNNAFVGIPLNDLFEYSPSVDDNELGIIVKVDDEIVETFTVSLDENAKDYTNKSSYIENVINTKSNYIYVVDNTANLNGVASKIDSSSITLVNGVDADITVASLLTAYELFNNKEEIEIDIVIGNELDGGTSAANLVNGREDCIAFIGAYQSDVVGVKSSIATTNLTTVRSSDTTGVWDESSMFCVLIGQYKYQYDRYSDKNRWVGIQGDIAGLREQTTTNRASWFASAGLERGQIKNVIKFAFNPNQAQRDLLYKVGINPAVQFPGDGPVMWGQKTALTRPSSFDRVNVRGLFNTLERALSKMARYQIMEFNDTFTRNRIVSMINPYLGSVKAGRGVQDFLVICDETNNTPDVISRNQLIVDVYIKPTYVAEFIQLRFTNAGTNSFSSVIGG
jgi:phage tail sheath protein FI